MAYIVSFIKNSFIFATLLVLQLPKSWFILKIILFLYCWPYFIIALYKKYNQKKSMLIICIQDFGIGLIKLGQFLATRSDLVGKDISEEFKTLQDNLPAIKFSKISYLISKDIKVEEQPIATASIAQVHKGQLANGKIVAVKILKPNIVKQIKVQTKMMYYFAFIINLCSKKFRKLGFLDMINEISRYLKNETDLLMEAAATDRFYRTVQDINIIIPKVYWDFCTKDVLVTQWIDGITLNKNNALDGYSQADRANIATSLLTCFLGQIYNDGVFQADPHQGNIIITPDKKIAILDFGRVGFIAEKEKNFLVKILHGFLSGDYKKVAIAHLEAGYIPYNANLLEFELACHVMGHQFIGKKLSEKINIADTLAQVINVALQFGMRSQKSLILFHKTIAMLEGSLITIDFKTDPWAITEPWIKKKIKQQYNPKEILCAARNKIIDFIDNLS